MASKIKVDNINKVSDDSNIIKKCGTTITLGASGDSIALATGASQTGFGRTGTVDWETTPKTSTFTGVSGKGYFINQGSAITCNLPAGTAGDIIAFSDYARNFGTYNFSISPNGSEKIGGVAENAKLSTDGQGATFVYVDSTKGWINIQNAEDTETGIPPYLQASGGNTTITDGDYKIHVFTGPGCFTVTNGGNPCGSTSVEYLVVAGGGGGGKGSGGGAGGAGGYRQNYPSPTTAGLSVSVQTYPITVGGGGTKAPGPTSCSSAGNGSNSIFSTITSTAGGGGGSENTCSGKRIGASGGSGGGGNYQSSSPGGTGNTPPTTPPQGNNGGTGGGTYAGGGGGGATAVGGSEGASRGGNGGTGGPLADAFFGPTAPSYGTPGPAGSTRYFAGGGGGGGQSPGASPAGTGGSGGGGAGGYNPAPGTAGTTNTGGGGGGDGNHPSGGGNGGSGIVMIRYKFQ